jgi:signal peptidase I
MIWAVVTAGSLIGALAVPVLVLRRRYLVIRAIGFSMVPALYPGDRLLVRRAGLPGLRAGTIVVLRDWRGGRPGDVITWLVKRLAAVPGDPVPEAARAACGNAAVVPPGMVIVLSENSSGTDSRQRGFASAGQLIGYVISPLSRSRGPRLPYRPVGPPPGDDHHDPMEVR